MVLVKKTFGADQKPLQKLHNVEHKKCQICDLTL